MLDRQDPAQLIQTPRLRKLLIYFCVLIFYSFFIVAFLQIKIVPEFVKIMDEFDVPEPETLKWSRYFAFVSLRYWYLIVFAMIALFWLVFTSWPGRRLRRAILDRLFRPLRELRTADVLQKLSVITQAGRPLSGALSTLARYHFDPLLRNQLLFIRNEMEQGVDVWKSMASVGLLSRPEAHLLETAERVGNRSWVLKQLSLLKQRRTTRRLSHWLELGLPLIIVLMGAFVLFQALAVFGPLVNIIYSQL